MRIIQYLEHASFALPLAPDNTTHYSTIDDARGEREERAGFAASPDKNRHGHGLGKFWPKKKGKPFQDAGKDAEKLGFF